MITKEFKKKLTSAMNRGGWGKENIKEVLPLIKDLEKQLLNTHVFCPHCGDKLQLKVETDLNSGRVCKSALCKGK